MSTIVPINRDYGHLIEIIQKMIAPDSHSSEPALDWGGVPVYLDPVKEVKEDENWDVFQITWNYYQDCGVIDPNEALAFFSAVNEPEWEGHSVSYYLSDFWDDADGRGTIYSWIEMDLLNPEENQGIYIDEENQFQILSWISIKNFCSRIMRSLTDDFHWEINEDDLANMLWALGKLSEFDPSLCVEEIDKVYWYWTENKIRKEFHEMISDFFAKPHITMPH